MKRMYIVYSLVCIMLILAACNLKIETQKPTTPKPPAQKLAWDNEAWSTHLRSEINSRQWSSDIKNHCKKLELKH